MQTLKNPNFFVSSRKGIVYQLTPFYQKSLKLHGIQISMGDFVLMDKVLEKLPQNNISFKKYIGYHNDNENDKIKTSKYEKQPILYLSPMDYYKNKLCLKGKNKKDSVCILGQNGYIDITNEKYCEMVTQMNPEIVVQLTEQQNGSGKGSSTRAVEKNIEFLEQLIEVVARNNNTRKEDQVKTKVYGSIQGGIYEDLREQSTQNLCARDTDGAVIHGLCQEETFDQRTNVYETILKNIPEEKKDILELVLSGTGGPVDIIHALQFGISLFEVEYPFKLAEYGYGSNLQPVNIKNLSKNNNNSDLNERIPNENFQNQKCNYFDLKNYQKYTNSIHGLVEGCTCYTCQNHTMGYIAHLFKCHELTGHVLLTIHNLHQYNILFAEIQEAINQNCVQEYIREFLKINTYKSGDNSEDASFPVEGLMQAEKDRRKIENGTEDGNEQKQQNKKNQKKQKKFGNLEGKQQQLKQQQDGEGKIVEEK